MKKSFVLITGFAFVLSAMPLLAEESLDATPPAKTKNTEMKKDKEHKGPFAALELTPEQREKIKDIMESGKAEREAMEKEREALKKKADAFREKQSEKIKAVLTPEQAKKFEEMKEKMEPGKGRLGKGFHPGDSKNSGSALK